MSERRGQVERDRHLEDRNWRVLRICILYVFVLFKQAEHMSTAWGKIRTGLLGAALNSSILSQGSANCASQAKFSPLSNH